MFDYEISHKCQYNISDTNDYQDCGEPAPYLVWWGLNEADEMWVCEDHFKLIKKCEEEEEQRIGRMSILQRNP